MFSIDLNNSTLSLEIVDNWFSLLMECVKSLLNCVDIVV